MKLWDLCAECLVCLHERISLYETENQLDIWSWSISWILLLWTFFLTFVCNQGDQWTQSFSFIWWFSVWSFWKGFQSFSLSFSLPSSLSAFIFPSFALITSTSISLLFCGHRWTSHTNNFKFSFPPMMGSFHVGCIVIFSFLFFPFFFPVLCHGKVSLSDKHHVACIASTIYTHRTWDCTCYGVTCVPHIDLSLLSLSFVSNILSSFFSFC